MARGQENEESIADLIRRECGDEIADRFLEAFAGVRCNIPADPDRISQHSRLFKLFGEETARKIASITGFVSEIIPLGEAKGLRFKKRQAEEMISKGHSVRDVALAVGVHERTVWRVRSEMSKASKKRAGQASARNNQSQESAWSSRK